MVDCSAGEGADPPVFGRPARVYVWQLISEVYPSVSAFLEEQLLDIDMAFKHVHLADPGVKVGGRMHAKFPPVMTAGDDRASPEA